MYIYTIENENVTRAFICRGGRERESWLLTRVRGCERERDANIIWLVDRQLVHGGHSSPPP